MFERPSVSIVVTTYNRKKLLKETIDSILNQTFQDFELLVIDNFSDYNFFSHMDSFYDNRIRPFQNQNNSIIAVNRNFGIKKTKGEYIAFCDDDDIWVEEKLSIQINAMLLNPKIIISYGYAKKIGPKTHFGNNNYGVLYRTMALTKKKLMKRNTIILSTALVKSDLIKSELFNESKELVGVEDFFLWNAIMKNGKFCLIKEILVHYRYHQNNASKIYSYNQSSYESQKRVQISRLKIVLNIFFSKIPMVYIKNMMHLLLYLSLRSNTFFRRSFSLKSSRYKIVQ